jgi:hypothetical protein
LHAADRVAGTIVAEPHLPFDPAWKMLSAGITMESSMSNAGLANRHRDKNGEISKKHGNTLVSTQRKIYGSMFAAGRVDSLNSLIACGSASLPFNSIFRFSEGPTARGIFRPARGFAVTSGTGRHSAVHCGRAAPSPALSEAPVRRLIKIFRNLPTGEQLSRQKLGGLKPDLDGERGILFSKEGRSHTNAHFQIFCRRRIGTTRVFISFRRLLRRQ